MFVRFVTSERDEDSHMAEGIFTAAYKAANAEPLPDWRREHLLACLRWFEEYLDVPRKLTRTSRRTGKRRAICWFKPSAAAHLQKAWELASVLEQQGVVIRKITCARIGAVVYEDDVQLAAVPFADTQARCRAPVRGKRR